MLPETLTLNSVTYVKDSDNTAAGTLYSNGSGFATKYLTIRQTKPAPGKSGVIRSLASLSFPIIDPAFGEYTSSSARVTINFTVTHAFGTSDGEVVSAVKEMVGFFTGAAVASISTDAAKFVDGQS